MGMPPQRDLGRLSEILHGPRMVKASQEMAGQLRRHLWRPRSIGGIEPLTKPQVEL